MFVGLPYFSTQYTVLNYLPPVTDDPGSIPPEKYVPGDVSMDSEVNVDDAQLVLKAYAETLAGNPIVLSPEQVKLSHVYGAEEENHICVEDSQAIFICAVNRLAGLVTDVSAFFEDYTANNTIPCGKECIYKN